MKNVLVVLCLALGMISCKKAEESPKVAAELPAVSPELADNAVIYEVNIRQYSPEGTFNAFTSDIPKLKKMGVKILWLMPIHEIGLKNRKATGDKSIEQITDPKEKEKYLGSYYSVKDYRSINPKFGTKADLAKLIQTAHENGIYVILDWVPNHTAWDHPWVTAHNDYYTHDKAGKMVAPFDWTDVADLNYDNKEMRKAMVADMKYWLTDFNVDGFRCDVAGEVPTDFWDATKVELNKVKSIFLLAEAEKPELLKNAFDMQYAWEAHHLFNQIAKGEKTAKDFDAYMTKIDTVLQKDDIYLNFTSNHDENSWNGSEYERMGDAVETFAALSFMMPGMPLIYCGQEYDLKKRLRFFEKDTIPHTVGKMGAVYEKLGALKANNVALHGGKVKAAYQRLTTSNDTNILAFAREKDGKKVIYVANMSKKPTTFTLPLAGNFVDYMSGEKIQLTPNQSHNFKPWEYKIFIQ